MCKECKPVEWSVTDYEMAIKLAIENKKPNEIVDGQMWISVYQQIINEEKGKRKTRKQLSKILDKIIGIIK